MSIVLPNEDVALFMRDREDKLLRHMAPSIRHSSRKVRQEVLDRLARELRRLSDDFFLVIDGCLSAPDNSVRLMVLVTKSPLLEVMYPARPEEAWDLDPDTVVSGTETTEVLDFWLPADPDDDNPAQSVARTFFRASKSHMRLIRGRRARNFPAPCTIGPDDSYCSSHHHRWVNLNHIESPQCPYSRGACPAPPDDAAHP